MTLHSTRLAFLPSFAVGGLVTALAPVAPGGDAFERPAPVPTTGATFIENAGQFDARVEFAALSNSLTTWFTADGFVVSARGDGEVQRGGTNLFFTFEGAAEDVVVVGEDVAETEYRFYRGADPARWREARGFGVVRYRGVYPDVDVVFRSVDGKLEYDVVAGPHGDPSRVVLRCEGADGLAIGDAGELRIATGVGVLDQAPPRSMRIDAAGARSPIESRFRLLDGERFGFEVGERQPGDAILIDPTLSYSTYLEGLVDEYGKAILTEPNGVCVVVGLTASADFPTVPGGHDTTHNGGYDIVVLRVNAAGSGLLSATFFGGSNEDRGFGVARDSLGALYITGVTKSTNFPVTPGVLQSTLKGSSDAYVLKFNASGSLAFASYLGGTGADTGLDIEVDSNGQIVVAGDTFSTDLPTTAGAFDQTYGGTIAGAHGDGFVVRVNATASALVSGTYLGGNSDDVVNRVAIDETGVVVVSGNAGNAAFPTTAGAFDTTFNAGPADGFVATLNAAGQLSWSTYLGGSGNDVLNDVACVPAALGGGCVVVGSVGSNNYPTTPSAYDTTYNGSNFDAAVTKLDPTGASLVYSTFLGGIQRDFCTAVACDPAGRAYVTGNSNSPDFPTSPGAWDTTWNGLNDLYVAKLDPDGSGLRYSSWIGGTGEEFDYAIAVDGAGAAYFTGYTAGTFPTTPGAFQTAPKGANDGTLTKFDLCTGSFSTYGSGCVGSGGFVPTLAGSGCPMGGFDITVTVAQALGGTTGLLLLGVGQGSVPLTPNCALQIVPIVPTIIVSIPILGAGAGNGGIPLTGAIPADQMPFDITMQVLIADPGGLGGFSSTNPLKMHLGP